MKCANCDEKSLYEYKLVQDKSIFYCGKHLPKFLNSLRKAGNLATTQHMADSVEEALDILSTEPKPKKKKTTKDEEPVLVEEPAPEEINEGNS